MITINDAIKNWKDAEHSYNHIGGDSAVLYTEEHVKRAHRVIMAVEQLMNDFSDGAVSSIIESLEIPGCLCTLDLYDRRILALEE